MKIHLWLVGVALRSWRPGLGLQVAGRHDEVLLLVVSPVCRAPAVAVICWSWLLPFFFLAGLVPVFFSFFLGSGQIVNVWLAR